MTSPSVPHSGVVLAREPAGKNPPWPPLRKGGKGTAGALRFSPPDDGGPLFFPPLRRGGQGGSISQPRGKACLLSRRLVLLLIAVAIGGASSSHALAQQP